MRPVLPNHVLRLTYAPQRPTACSPGGVLPFAWTGDVADSVPLYQVCASLISPCSTFTNWRFLLLLAMVTLRAPSGSVRSPGSTPSPGFRLLTP